MEASGYPEFERHSSQGRLLHSSPLDTLVRRTSSRRQATKQQTRIASQANASTIPPSLQPHHAPPQPAYAVSPPRPFASQRAPDSPLLHSNFRTSTASVATNIIALHTSRNSNSFLSFTDDCEPDDGCYEEDNKFGQRPQPSSIHNHNNSYPAFPIPSANTTRPESPIDLWPQATGLIQPATLNYTDPSDPMYSPPSSLPTVIVSSPQDDGSKPSGPLRQPIVSQNGSPRLNFSRPGRPPILSSEEQKRQVLERNAQRANSPRMSPTPVSFSPVTPVTGVYPEKHHMLDHLASSEFSSPSSASASASYLRPDGFYSSPLLASPSHVTLPSHPPSLRAGSALSLYSNSYSFYQLDRSTPSPSPTSSQSPRSTPDISPATSRPVSAEPQTPEEYLQMGIKSHEANQLKDSAVCFEKSAKEQGGCSVGMLMWGLTLRHGWGCEKNEKSGFKWLTKAAELAVEDLEEARKGLDARGVKVSCPFLCEMKSVFEYAMTGRTCACHL